VAPEADEKEMARRQPDWPGQAWVASADRPTLEAELPRTELSRRRTRRLSRARATARRFTFGRGRSNLKAL